jgi:hypothetical protein
VSRVTALASAVCIAVATIGCGDQAAGQDREAGTMPDKTIESVLQEHTDALMAIPGVVGTAQSECDGAPCIKVYVAEMTNELRSRIPPTIEGYTVSIQETGPIRAR